MGHDHLAPPRSPSATWRPGVRADSAGGALNPGDVRREEHWSASTFGTGTFIAGTVLAGSTFAAVARQLGVSRPWASREANAAGTRVLVAQVLAPHRAGG